MTKIIGWDVGIKNLAYCIINKNNETNTFKIEQWKIIDLTEHVEYSCCGLLKKKKNDTEAKKCDKTAKYYVEDNGETKYYCAVHKKQYTINIDDIEKQYVKDYENKDKQILLLCQYIMPRSNKQCNKKAGYEFKDELCCKTHKELLLKNKIKELSIKPIKKDKSLFDPQILCERMYKKLSELKDIETIDEVYIENQPTHINPVMKAVSSMLFSYFVYIFSSKNLTNKKVKFVAPSSKLELTKELMDHATIKINNHNAVKKNECCCRLCKLNEDITKNHTDNADKYKEYKLSYEGTKEMGIIYAEKILENNDKHALELIKDYSKKDDLCDAFLHGYRKMTK